jgi:hypothetical protein
MLKPVLSAVAAFTLLAGCGAAPTATSALSASGDISAQKAKKAPTKVEQGLFDKLTGLVSLNDDQNNPGHKWLDFEFGTKGLIFSDAVRKQATFTVNGEPFEGGWGVEAAADGKLYIPRHDTGAEGAYYVLGTWERPADMKAIGFRQKVAIKFDMDHTFTLHKPFNPMGHIEFTIDLKKKPVLAKTAPTLVRF